MADGIRGICWVLHIDSTPEDIFLAAFRIVPRRVARGKLHLRGAQSRSL